MEFPQKNGDQVRIREDPDAYWEKITHRNSDLEKGNNYYLKGHLKMEAVYFHGGGNFNAGSWRYYEGNGKLTKTENHDAPSEIPMEESAGLYDCSSYPSDRLCNPVLSPP